MKKLRSIVTIIFVLLILTSTTSCAVRMHEDNGRHRGWFHRNDHRHHEKRTVLIVKNNDRNHR